MEKYIAHIKEYSKNNYKKMLRKPCGILTEPFIVPGSASYNNSLWDWDSYFTDIALRQIMKDNNETDLFFEECEKGCIINFLKHITPNGRIPISVLPERIGDFFDEERNCHKPCLCQHAEFVIKENGGDVSWLIPYADHLIRFVSWYMEECRHEPTGLYFWLDDTAIGVDNDPCTFYRPPKSSASVYLNCLMYKELLSLVHILNELNIDSKKYYDEAVNLKTAIREHLWDERDGFYYSADINLLPVDKSCILHSGAPRHWSCLIQRIGVWSGFMAMWAGVAEKRQAQRMVSEHLMCEDSFCAYYGVRTLAQNEKMYTIEKTGNPSCWLGPIWGISNWMCFEGLVNYGFTAEAKLLAEKTIRLLGRDIELCGEMHEYYHPDTGDGVNNPGFQNWNLLVNNMISWYENGSFIS